MAEAHPVGFQWVMEAKKRGATVIHVDPRFTRTSALADVYVSLRAGSDIAFLGGLVNYVLENELDFREYVVAYTNAAAILREDYQGPDDLDGLFSGYDPDGRHYDSTTWQYEGADTPSPGSGEMTETEPAQGAGGDPSASSVGGAAGRAASYGDTHGSGGAAIAGKPRRDETLQHPRCVYQVIKRHFARYTPEVVSQVCGVPEDQFLRVARAMTENSGRERTTALCYAVGWTHHSVGAQYIRTAAILQALLGNIGRPGGGILALRGHASIQGSTDIPTLFNLLPGYIPMPHANAHPDLESLVGDEEKQAGFWGNMRSYVVSLLKSWYGDAATADNDFCYGWLPRLTGNHGTYQTVADMVDGKVKGYFLVGENPAVGSANAKMQRRGLASLDWLVVRDLVMIESATFWREAPEIETGEMRTEDIATEVFVLPAAAHTEKDGTFTNTQRLLQWHHKAVEPPDDARSDLWFYFHLGRRIREKLAGSTDERDAPLLNLTWDYPTDGPTADPSADAVLREINGTGPDGSALSAYTELKADGSTRSGCWIYCGVYADEANQAARRKPGQEQTWVAPEWGWAWPANRRMLYNRAAADRDGNPWSERKRYVWWDAKAGKWTGEDVPDFIPDRDPHYVPPEGATGPDAIAGDDPFVMQTDGKAWLFAPQGVADGPLPSHYEPPESPVANPLYRQQQNPARELYTRRDNLLHPSGAQPGSEVFPYVFTTYRVTEHHTAGGMSRTLPYLSELQPELFVEISPALADERKLEHLGWATVITARTAIEARVLVTDRMRPLTVDGSTVHQVGIPWHWGPGGLSRGDAANDLVAVALDPNVHIQDKVGSCDIRPGRRPRGPALLEYVEEYRRRAGITELTGTEGVTP
jgi:formate dehydrogenase major subunit